MNTRRKFLFDCAAFAAVVFTPPLPLLGGILDFHPADAPLDKLSFARWAAQLHTSFRVHAAPGRVVKVRLVQAVLDPPRLQHGRRPSPDADNEKFSLVFSGPNDEKLPQETFKFEHGQLGRFDLFIVPVFARNPQITKYAAILNRSRQNETTGLTG